MRKSSEQLQREINHTKKLLFWAEVGLSGYVGRIIGFLFWLGGLLTHNEPVLLAGSVVWLLAMIIIYISDKKESKLKRTFP